MEFGPIPVEDAEGRMLAHSIRIDGQRHPKGKILSREDVASLVAAGIAEIWAARLGPDDLAEDEAAALIAAPMAGEHLTISAPFTGRVNIYADSPGLFRVDAGAINAANGVDEAITIATLPDFTRVTQRQMLATVKIIPYAAPVDAAKAAAERLSGALSLHPFVLRQAALILTQTEGMKPSLIEKGAAAITTRLTALGIDAGTPVVTAHETASLTEALRRVEGDIILILGGSATSDRRDVGPAAVEAAGGRIERFGMPVDPGNLLFIGELYGRPVLGLPGCARSPKLNGADLVLERLAAGLEVSDADIAGMGVGGLLKEIPSRPQPRDGKSAPGRALVSAVLLAAGSSSRMRGADKLMEDAGGMPLLRRSAEALLAAQVDELVVVLRPGDEARRGALEGLSLRVVENAQAAEGMGASIRTGMAAISPEAEAALIALADMPEITGDDINALVAAYDAEEGREIIRAAAPDGKAGNPVLFGRRFFEPLRGLEGDEGARSLLAANADLVRLTPLKSRAARIDLDTPEDWAAWRALKTD